MSRVCPKPCGRLATAAVFIAVGVVQLLVGVILLRSKYADLLSGPDFITAATNIIVGCLYGIAASVWKSNRKKITVKRTARKNVLAALLVSVITVNITASIVLLMSEGNKLLTLEYFGGIGGISSAAFAKEVLASAYVASVCSPIVCIVVALVALSGNCFRMPRTENEPRPDSSIKKVENAFGWVYEEKSNSAIGDSAGSSSSSNQETSSSATSVFSNADSISIKRKPFSSVKNIPSPVHTWRHKRAAILKNDSLSRKRTLFDECLQNSEYLDRSREGLIPRIKESSLIRKKSMPIVATGDTWKKSDRNGKWLKENIVPNTTHLCIQDEKNVQKIRNDSYTNANLEGNKIKEENLGRKCVDVISRGVGTEEERVEARYFSDESPEHFRNHRPSFDGPTRNGTARIPKGKIERSEIGPDEHFEDPEILRIRQMTLKELKRRVHSAMPGTHVNHSDLPKEETNMKYKADAEIRNSPPEDYCEVIEERYLKENVSPDIVFEPRSNSKQIDTEETYVKHLYSDGPSVFKPTASSSLKHPKPLDLSKSRIGHTGLGTGRGILKTKTLDISNYNSELIHHEGSSEGVHLSDKKRTIVETYPSVSSMKLHKKRETKRKMASIAEIPTEGSGECKLNQSLPVAFSRRTTSFDEDSRNLDENYNVKVHSPTRRSPAENIVRKSTSFSPKSILKKMWSSAGADVRLDVSDLIVDEDSLIGLSEDDLIARTQRIRSLRKAVEERLKSEKSSQ